MYQPDQFQVFLETGDRFLEAYLNELSQTGLAACDAHWVVDHLAYMTSDLDEYRRLRDFLLDIGGREIKSDFDSITIGWLQWPFSASLPVSIKPDEEADRVETDLIELIYRPSEGGEVSTFHHVGLKPVKKFGADQLASRFRGVKPQRVSELVDGSEAYDVLLEDQLLVRISDVTLLAFLTSRHVASI